MNEQLDDAARLLIEVPLVPVQGDRFQPTGFPDIGAGLYTLPDGTRKVLLESAQSVANRLENTILGHDNTLLSDFDGLPYVAVNLSGAGVPEGAKTNSLIEAHRLNSPFIISDPGFKEAFTREAGYAKGLALNWQKIGRALFKFDVNALLHGVFFANIDDGRIKVPRALTGFIEARGVKEIVSGGVKNNAMDPSGTIRAKAYAEKNVYGNVPYQRIEYTAEAINAYFNLDLGMIRSYGLGKDAERLLCSLALYKIRSFLNDGLRLRTACDLMPKNGSHLEACRPKGYEIPNQVTLKAQVVEGINVCKPMFADPSVTIICTETVVMKEKKNATEETE